MPIVVGLAALLLLALVTVVVALYYLVIGIILLVKLAFRAIRRHRTRRLKQAECERERTEQELRESLFFLTDSLNVQAHEARRALLRESLKHKGQLPPGS